MMRKLKIVLLSLLLCAPGFVVFAPTAQALSAPTPPSPMTTLADLKGDATAGLNQVGGGGTDIGSIISTVVKILSYVVGLIAVVMVVVSAIKFATSGGDSSKVSSAKSTLTYALIGLAIAALAQVLVNFALKTADNPASVQTCASNPSIEASDPKCK